MGAPLRNRILKVTQSSYVSCGIVVFLKARISLKCASDLFLPSHDGASTTSNHGLCSMNGNRSLRCGVIDQPFELRTKT